MTYQDPSGFSRGVDVNVRLFDTMSRSLEPVEPIEPGHVRVYTCGPTVYARQHVGNYRTFVFEDVLRRWLERRFTRVTHVMNLTDVDDKIIASAAAHGHDLGTATAPHIAGFFEDLDSLGIRRAHHYPRATAYIDGMVEIIRRLQQRGLTYERDGSTYFRIAGFPAYGRLSGASAGGLVAGASGRIDADEYSKDDVRDFALWKAVEADEIGWDTPLGRGRPGWHIECSAMSMALLGEHFDIHCGGVDNIFPHHENEIAQSEGSTGRRFVNIWCHSAHLRVDGEKMAKSAGNVYTLQHLFQERGTNPSAVRYLLAATTHYRKPLNYVDEAVEAAAQAVDRLVTFRDRAAALVPTEGYGAGIGLPLADGWAGFASALDDDLNMPEAMGAVFSTIRDVNRLLDGRAPNGAELGSLHLFIADVDDVLGVFPLVDDERRGALGAVDAALLEERARARTARDWVNSDRVRDELAGRGIAVEDTPHGQRWHRVGSAPGVRAR